MNRGENFEKSLPKSDYFNEAYFDIRQLMAQTMQIKLIHEMKPESIIEIGIGNGLTSSFFKNSGLEIVTADINSNLKSLISDDLNSTQTLFFTISKKDSIETFSPLSDLSNMSSASNANII